jgi:hypothetical protein
MLGYVGVALMIRVLLLHFQSFCTALSLLLPSKTHTDQQANRWHEQGQTLPCLFLRLVSTAPPKGPVLRDTWHFLSLCVGSTRSSANTVP